MKKLSQHKQMSKDTLMALQKSHMKPLMETQNRRDGRETDSRVVILGGYYITYSIFS